MNAKLLQNLFTDLNFRNSWNLHFAVPYVFLNLFELISKFYRKNWLMIRNKRDFCKNWNPWHTSWFLKSSIQIFFLIGKIWKLEYVMEPQKLFVNLANFACQNLMDPPYIKTFHQHTFLPWVIKKLYH